MDDTLLERPKLLEPVINVVEWKRYTPLSVVTVLWGATSNNVLYRHLTMTTLSEKHHGFLVHKLCLILWGQWVNQCNIAASLLLTNGMSHLSVSCAQIDLHSIYYPGAWLGLHGFICAVCWL